jgi:manganese/zinc/iron transport system permease protein
VIFLAALNWNWSLDGWIIAAGVLCALSCALLGNFMVLRRMSMMGDAISHAVLPGLAAAFLITGSRGSLTMLIGAAVVGVLTAALTQFISSLAKVEESASMGIVFTSLFAVGLIMIRRAADHVDLDPGCVLYGLMEGVPLDRIDFLGMRIPRVVLILAVMLIINLLFVALFYKELKITSFDPGLATTLGINANVMHYLLMTLVAATTVASFEAVGSILVVAMLIVPAAAAHLLTDRLSLMIVVSMIIAVICGIVGHIAAIVVPQWFGFRGTTTAGMMATVAGVLFLVTLLAAPRHGVISRLFHRALLSLRILREDILGTLYRHEEKNGPAAALSSADLRHATGAGDLSLVLAILGLRGRHQLQRIAAGYGLNETGREAARALLRSHRLWETYLVDQLQIRADHSHRTAEYLEHITTPQTRDRLSAAAADATTDPQGKPIPRE